MENWDGINVLDLVSQCMTICSDWSRMECSIVITNMALVSYFSWTEMRVICQILSALVPQRSSIAIVGYRGNHLHVVHFYQIYRWRPCSCFHYLSTLITISSKFPEVLCSLSFRCSMVFWYTELLNDLSCIEVPEITGSESKTPF